MARVTFDGIGRAFAVGTLAEVWRTGSRIIITPIILSSIGFAGYGVWALVFALTAYVNLTNGGMGTAYTKFTAEYARQGEYERLREILGAGSAVVGSVALVAMVAAWLWGDELLAVINVPTELLADGHIALLVVLGAVFARMTLGISYDVLGGLQRNDLHQALTILASFIEFVITVPLLLLDYGLVGMAIGYLVGQLCSFTLGGHWVRREDPKVQMSPVHATRAGLREVGKLGGALQGLAFANISVGEGVKVLLTILIDPRATALYELASRVVYMMRAPTTAAVAPMLSAFAGLRAGGEGTRERELLRVGRKAILILSGSMAAFLMVLGGPALLLWTGEAVPDAAWALRWMSFATFLISFTAVPAISLRAQGLVGLEVRFAVINSVVFVATLLVFVTAMPFESVVIARVVSPAVGVTWFVRAFLKSTDMTAREWWRGGAMGPSLLVIAASATTVGLVHHFFGSPDLGLSPRLGAAVDLCAFGLVYGAMLVTGVWKFSLTADERRDLAAYLARRFGRLANKLRRSK
jgi:O-antigen/teichoic acid export membrane protein